VKHDVLSPQAMQWVADHVQYPAIVSASIAGDYSAAVNQAVQSLVNDFGIPVVAAAGIVHSFIHSFYRCSSIVC